MRPPTPSDDAELTRRLDALVRHERENLVEILACIADVERRELDLQGGYADIYDYCTRRLRYGEGAAMQRVYAARAAARHPEMYSLLAEGKLNLGTAARIGPHLTAENASALLARASEKSKREVEAIIFELAEAERALRALEAARRREETEPLLPVGPPLSIEGARDVAAPPAAAAEARSAEPPATGTAAGPAAAEREAGSASFAGRAPRSSERLVAPGITRIVLEADDGLMALLGRARRFMSWSVRARGLEAQLRCLLEDYLGKRDPERRAPTAVRRARRSRERRVPRWVRDRVWARDGGRCSFLGADGVRCRATGGLEFDHKTPWALGGTSDDPDNIRLLCRAHNLHLARRTFGARAPARGQRPSSVRQASRSSRPLSTS